MLPPDLTLTISVSQPALSPDAATVAFVVTRVDDEQNSYRSQVWLVPTDGSAPPHPFTSGDFKDGNPTWSPDGDRLAFTSTRGGGEHAKASLHVAPVRGGGEVVTVAKLDEGASALAWSPDGHWLAFCSRTRAEGYDEDEAKHPPRRITRLFSRLDDEGFTVDRPLHTYIVPANGAAAPRNLTPGEPELDSPAWLPDSSAVVVSGATHDTRDLDLAVDLHRIDLASGERTTLTGRTGVYGWPSVSPGGRIAFLGTDDVATYPRNSHVGVLGPADHTWVSTELDRTFEPFPHARRPAWLDEDTLLASVADRGDTHLYRVSADGSRPPVPHVTGEGAVTGFDARAGVVAFTRSTHTRPGDLFVLADGEERRLTDLTAGFAEQARLRAPEHFVVTSTDGAVELDAWVLTPPELDPTASYPLLVNVHGGPFTQYDNGFLDERHLQARAGYVVLWCNPRGGSGREEAFGRAVVGPALGGTGWGSVDYDDVMAVLDHTLATRSYVDSERVGIIGGSYGGFMTSWAISHTDRFAAACSERAANNLLSLEYASDAAGAFRTYLGVSHLDDPELYLQMSPVSYVKDIDTPLLIVHSEQDLRCPIDQADQLFTALRMLRKEVEMVRFPGESHELSRSGSPTHRRQRAEIILEFFDRHLRPADRG